MLHRRLHRHIVAWVLAFCVVFAQSAALAYACQREGGANLDAKPPCAAHLVDPAGAPSGATPADANVCEVHCHDVSLPDAGATDVPAASGIVAWMTPPLPVAVPSATPAAELEAKSAAPPARTLFARLLI